MREYLMLAGNIGLILYIIGTGGAMQAGADSHDRPSRTVLLLMYIACVLAVFRLTQPYLFGYTVPACLDYALFFVLGIKRMVTFLGVVLKVHPKQFSPRATRIANGVIFSFIAGVVFYAGVTYFYGGLKDNSSALNKLNQKIDNSRAQRMKSDSMHFNALTRSNDSLMKLVAITILQNADLRQQQGNLQQEISRLLAVLRLQSNSIRLLSVTIERARLSAIYSPSPIHNAPTAPFILPDSIKAILPTPNRKKLRK